MAYVITPEIRRRASSLGVIVKPSTNTSKKIDVYQNNRLIAQIGQANAMDYHLWVKEKGVEYANKRRDLYYKRHPYNVKTIKGVYTADYLAKKLLW